jgi:hypothetical protein
VKFFGSKKHVAESGSVSGGRLFGIRGAGHFLVVTHRPSA